jgi:hypothetical protein
MFAVGINGRGIGGPEIVIGVTLKDPLLNFIYPTKRSVISTIKILSE